MYMYVVVITKDRPPTAYLAQQHSTRWLGCRIYKVMIVYIYMNIKPTYMYTCMYMYVHVPSRVSKSAGKELLELEGSTKESSVPTSVTFLLPLTIDMTMDVTSGELQDGFFSIIMW